VFWAGVAAQKYAAYGRLRCALLGLHIGVGISALVGLVLSVFGRHWLGLDAREFGIVLGLALIASVGWWRDWSLPVVAILAGPLLAAVTVFTYVVVIVVFFTDGVEQAPATIRKIWNAAARKLKGTSGPAAEAA
jgi:hypothetical protein